MSALIAVYRAWPWRPHCDGPRHVRLCSLLGMSTRCYHEHHDR